MRGSDATDIRVETDRQAEPIILIIAADNLAPQEPRQQRRAARTHSNHRFGADGDLLIDVDEDPEAADVCGYAEGVDERQIAIVTVDLHANLQGAPMGPSALATGWLGGRVDGTDTGREGHGLGRLLFVGSWPRPGAGREHQFLRVVFSESLSSIHLNPFGCSHNSLIADFST